LNRSEQADFEGPGRLAGAFLFVAGTFSGGNGPRRIVVWKAHCGRSGYLNLQEAELRHEDDGRSRCPWSLGVSGDYLAYHDEEWGFPARDDRGQFEFLILESAQAGLSWSTILHKRAAYGRAFAGFDPDKVARFNSRSVKRLLSDTGIVRNRLKIESAISNARLFLEVRAAYGSFSEYLWGFVDGRPVVNRWRSQSEVPATTDLSDRISQDLKRRGFRFVGSTIIYAHLQATGLVNDHLTDCFRYQECQEG
jgi:DNA-3-methyladenine glycosylase I